MFLFCLLVLLGLVLLVLVPLVTASGRVDALPDPRI